jgi:hypothetical protein
MPPTASTSPMPGGVSRACLDGEGNWAVARGYLAIVQVDEWSFVRDLEDSDAAASELVVEFIAALG